MPANLTRTQSFLLGTVVLVLATLGIGWLGKSMIDDQPLDVIDFWLEGYYRDGTADRLFTVGYRTAVSESEIRAFADQLTYTPGHVTTAFFYPEGSRIPSRGVTGAASLADAQQALRMATGASPWRYAAVKDAQGQLTLVDCMAEPNNRLCRF